ncbi:MAG: GNAT family N-acetyltransferase, partial [Aquincola sp.]|nr:GNAT family N-acetyltransferase [Aquincola sp.]
SFDRALRQLSPRLGLRVYELMVQPIGVKALLPPNLTRNLTFGFIGRDHPDVSRMALRDGILDARLDQGARCMGVWRKGTLIGYLWFCSGRYHEDEVRCTYELTETDVSVFDFDLVVLPEHRLGIGFMAVWHAADQLLRERGVRFTFSRLTRFNVASRRAHAHLGWRCVGRAVFVEIFGAEVMLATLPPFVGLTWGTRRVHLRLAPHALSSAALASEQPPVESSP